MSAQHSTDIGVTCSRGGRDGENYDCTATYFVNADGSEFRRSNIEGHYRGKKIEYVDGFGVSQVVGDAEQKVSVPYNCHRQGRGKGFSVLTERIGHQSHGASSELR